MNKYLITGASGFVGSCLVRNLIEKGEQVSIIVRNKNLNWRLKDLVKKIDIHEGDLTDSHSVEKIVNKIKPNIIFHLAAYGTRPGQTNFRQLVESNIESTRNLILATAKHGFKIFIHTGSSSEYGIKNRSMKETDLTLPLDDYGVTKTAATLLCQKYALRDHLPITIFRIFSPYGYFEEMPRFIPYLILNSLRNKPLFFSRPANVRDFVFIEDVIKAYLKAVTQKEIAKGEIFNIGSGQQHRISEVVEIVKKITKTKAKISWHTTIEKRFVKEPKIWQADISKAKKFLGWQPKHNLYEGLKKTVRWFNKNIKYYENQ